MKTANYFVYVALLVLASIFLAGCGKQTIDGAALPEFYGLFAIDGGKLIQIKQNEVPNYSENITFLFFDKNVAAAENVTIYSIGFDTEPHPVDDGSFSWQKFAQAGEAYQRASQAAMSGIPEGAVPIETLKKPVPNKNEMLQFVPATPLKPGLYQFGNAVKFWVYKEKYQTTVESNARQELQTGHWVDASRFATIALLVGTSSPNVVDEMTQIKYGALSKGANEALKQGNFDLAESFAKRGNDLRPPSQFASDFSQLLNIEIPYQQALKAATAASQQEDWDLLTRAGGAALNLKPNDPKAINLLSRSPKLLLSGYHGLESLCLTFTLDGETLFAGFGYPSSFRGRQDFRYDLIWNVAGKQFLTPVENPLKAIHLDSSGNLVAFTTDVNWNVIQFKDIKTGSDSILSMSALDNYGLTRDGSILWTDASSWRREDLSKYGLLSAAEAIGLNKNGNIYGNMSGTIIWNVKTSKAIAIVGFSDYSRVQNIVVPPDSNIAIMCQEGYRGPSAQVRNKFPDCLSVWDIATQKLLVKFNSGPENMLALCAVRADETSAIVYEGELQMGDFGASPTAERCSDNNLIIQSNPGKFRFLNWSSFKVTHEVKVPADVSLVAINPNSKYVAYASKNDSVIRIAELDTWKIVYSFKEASGVKVKHLAFSPDGTYLAVSLDRNADFLALWKIPDDLKPLIAEKPTRSNVQNYSSIVTNSPDNNSVSVPAVSQGILAKTPEESAQALAVPAALQATLAKAQAGDAEAQYKLGKAYSSGEGIDKNYAEAVKWFQKGADQENADAQNALGFMYKSGWGVDKNNAAAISWFQKAADQGNAKAELNLGIAYEFGQGVDKNYPEAIKSYLKAAEQGNANAQCNLGSMYQQGRGVSKDYFEAVKWYRKSVEQGYAFAQLDLGMMYKNGCGVDKDYTEARKWIQKAADQGNEYAKRALQQLNNGQ